MKTLYKVVKDNQNNDCEGWCVGLIKSEEDWQNFFLKCTVMDNWDNPLEVTDWTVEQLMKFWGLEYVELTYNPEMVAYMCEEYIEARLEWGEYKHDTDCYEYLKDMIGYYTSFCEMDNVKSYGYDINID